MPITMVKKLLANGEPCRKCAQAEELLRTRGLWDKIDEVILALEADADSPGMRLAQRFGIDTAPFFVVSEGSAEPKVYTSALRFIKDVFAKPRDPAVEAPSIGETELAELTESHRDRSPAQILSWGLERFGANCAIAFSGAEDVVLIDMAKKTGLPFSVFSLDTGRLHPETYRFIDRVRVHYEIEIALMAPETVPVQDLVQKKGLFSFYQDGHHECCGIRKVEPLERALLQYSAWVTGQRRDQSPATRTQVGVIERDASHSGRNGMLVKLNPLTHWSLAQVWSYIRDNQVPYNELHDKGFVSIGCEPCTRAIRPGEHERAGRWWWEEATQRECGLHVKQPIER